MRIVARKPRRRPLVALMRDHHQPAHRDPAVMEMSVAAAGCIEAAARLLAADPGAVARATARHRPEDERCAVCDTAWPCVVGAAAGHALAHLDVRD